jgi:hypothetical protein
MFRAIPNTMSSVFDQVVRRNWFAVGDITGHIDETLALCAPCAIGAAYAPYGPPCSGEAADVNFPIVVRKMQRATEENK